LFSCPWLWFTIFVVATLRDALFHSSRWFVASHSQIPSLSANHHQLLSFADHKSSTLYHQKQKAANLRWTQTWRRNHKKVKVEAVAKKKSKRAVNVARSVGGMSLEELKKRQTQKPEVRQAAREAALRYAFPIHIQ
jgi:hypothetical protein